MKTLIACASRYGSTMEIGRWIAERLPWNDVDILRARAKITLHFGISSSSHFRQILKSKNLEIVHYYSAFCSLKSTEPNLNLSANSVKLFLREP